MLNRRIMIGLLLIVISAFGWCSERAYAGVIYGNGATTSNGEFHGCNEAKRWQNVGECPNGDGRFGGVSWHIFSTSKKPVHDEGEPSDNHVDRPILPNNELYKQWNKADSDWDLSDCDSGYYIALVYDGWYGAGNNWSNKTLFYYGPLAWKQYEQHDGSNTHIPIYHTGGDHTATDINNGFKNGTNMNGWRIKGQGPTNGYATASQGNWQSDDATALYRQYADNDSANIPKVQDGFATDLRRLFLLHTQELYQRILMALGRHLIMVIK